MKNLIGILIVTFSFSPLFGQIDFKSAERLVALPLKCAQQEFPNKLGQVLNSATDLTRPAELHPAFYGCFDWHSAVHGQWLMVRLLKTYPNLTQAANIRSILSTQLSEKNIQQEIAFFGTKNNESFERLYGWAWTLKLQQELDTWEDSLGQICAKNLRPLSALFCQKTSAFLPKLVYPIRTGEHTNTAFGLCFIYDYAQHSENHNLQMAIEKRAKEWYGNDTDYRLQFEPSGYDFLSPALEEVDLMRRVLKKDAFDVWLKKFLPSIYSKQFELLPGKVIDRTDGKLVHLDGLNFSRAWCLYALAQSDKNLKHLQLVADEHIEASLPNIVDGDYMGEHWLASFAVLSLMRN